MAAKGASKGRDRRGAGRAVKDLAELDVDERTLDLLTLVVASFGSFKAGGPVLDLPREIRGQYVTLADIERAERLLEGVL